jgi:hypothetical protein
VATRWYRAPEIMLNSKVIPISKLTADIKGAKQFKAFIQIDRF